MDNLVHAAGVGRRNRLIISSWNVEGLTDLKLYEICSYMKATSVDVMCLQETWKLQSDRFTADFGYAVMLSGATGTQMDRAGVGFIVSPKLLASIIGFTPFSNRLACLRTKVSGGSMAIFSVYAPHNLRPLDERIGFYEQLDTALGKTSVNGGTLVFGDLNARLGPSKAGEDNIVGQFSFGREAQHRVETPNMDLLVEFCFNHGYAIANTLLPNPPHKQVTYHEIGASPFSQITIKDFAVLDLLLVPRRHAVGRVLDLWSDRLASIGSHHFPVTAVVDARLERKCPKRPARLDWTALTHAQYRDEMLNEITQNSLGHCMDASIDEKWNSMRSILSHAASKCLPIQAHRKSRPWISDITLKLIAQRSRARGNGDSALDKRLSREMKA